MSWQVFAVFALCLYEGGIFVAWRMGRLSDRWALGLALGPLALLPVALLVRDPRRLDEAPQAPYEPPETDPGVLAAERVIDAGVTTDLDAVEEAETEADRMARLLAITDEAH